MWGGRGRGGGSFFSDPFGLFGPFGGFGNHSLMPSLFGGRDPFDDPFFTQPPGSMFQSSFFGPHGNPFLGAPFPGAPFPGAPFPGAPNDGFMEQQEPHRNKWRGPVIEEISSDDEKVETECPKSNEHPRKKASLDKELYVEVPDDEGDGGSTRYIQCRAEVGNRMNNTQPLSKFYTFQSSTVSYGGGNGAYYTKSMTKRAGSDGVAFEEFKEADSTTGQANHRISRGLHDKGHTLSRKLNSDGKVDTAQMLHNLNEGELDGFEQAWEGSSGRHLTGSRQRLEGNYGRGGGQSGRRGWALPSTEHTMNPGWNNPTASGSNADHVHPQVGRIAGVRRSGGGRSS